MFQVYRDVQLREFTMRNARCASVQQGCLKSFAISQKHQNIALKY